MNEQAVAYSVTVSDDGFNDQYQVGVDGCFDSIVDGNRIVTMFSSSEACRTTLRVLSSTIPVVVCDRAGSVSPINLAAALCADSPERDVYLIEDQPTRSLASRARAAGIRGILDRSQADCLLSIDRWAFAGPFDGTPRGANKGERDPRAQPERGTLGAMRSLPEPAWQSLSKPAARLSPEPVRLDEQEGRPSQIASLGREGASVAPVPSSTMGLPPRKGCVVGFFSGRGGVGKSTVALMTALAAQKRGLTVALIDLDLQFGDMGYLAGKEPASRIQQLSLAQMCSQEGMPLLSEDVLALVLAPDRPEQGEQFVSAIPHLLERLACQRDLVVINTGSFWTDAHALAVQNCDHLIFLMDQRATSVEACKQAVDLCLRLKAPQIRFRYLLNGCGRHAALMPMDVSLALGGVEVCGLADGGALVDELLSLGCPLELLTSGNAFIASLDDFLDGLMDGHPATTPRADREKREATRGKGMFNIPALRGLFEGARHVAP
jgi:pilus assembly protein CpaE